MTDEYGVKELNPMQQQYEFCALSRCGIDFYSVKIELVVFC